MLRRNQWEVLPEMNLPESRLHSSDVVSGDSIYVVSGMSIPGDSISAQNTLCRLKLGESREGWPTLPPFPGSGLISIGVSEVEETIDLYGGAHAAGTSVVNSNVVFEFDCKRQRWERLPDLPVSCRAWCAVPLPPQCC